MFVDDELLLMLEEIGPFKLPLPLALLPSESLELDVEEASEDVDEVDETRACRFSDVFVPNQMPSRTNR